MTESQKRDSQADYEYVSSRLSNPERSGSVLSGSVSGSVVPRALSPRPDDRPNHTAAVLVDEEGYEVPQERYSNLDYKTRVIPSPSIYSDLERSHKSKPDTKVSSIEHHAIRWTQKHVLVSRRFLPLVAAGSVGLLILGFLLGIPVNNGQHCDMAGEDRGR